MDANGKEEDRVKTAATIMATVPQVVVGIGWSVLKMKRRARKSSRQMRRELVRNGMPTDIAARMAEEYAAEFSIRDMMQGLIRSNTSDHPHGKK